MKTTRVLSRSLLTLALAAWTFLAPVVSAAGGHSPTAAEAWFDDGMPGAGAPTRVRLLRENDAAWYARWWLMSTATESLDLTYFEFFRDIYTRALLGKLLERAQDGLTIRLMVDARGSKELVKSAFLKELAEYPNVEIRVFKPLSNKLLKAPWSVKRFVAANHDKIMVADGVRVLTGGRNNDGMYFADWEDDAAAYRDTDVMMEGAVAAAAATAAFTEEFERLVNHTVAPQAWWRDWEDEQIELALASRVMQRWMTDGTLLGPDETPYQELLGRLNSEIQAYPGLVGYPAFEAQPWNGTHVIPSRVLDKHSYGDPKDEITPGLLGLIAAAKQRITIQNPFLVLSQEAFQALRSASQRGVRIVFQTNGPSARDSVFTQAFFLREWKTLLKEIPTLEVYMFEDRHVVHAKVMVVDDKVCVVGSYNMDPMSQDLNSEVAVAFRDSSLSTRLRLRIEADVARSKRCEIAIDAAGNVTGVYGPEDQLEGAHGFWIRLVSKLGFLRPLV